MERGKKGRYFGIALCFESKCSLIVVILRVPKKISVNLRYYSIILLLFPFCLFGQNNNFEMGTGISPIWLTSNIKTRSNKSSAGTLNSVFPPAIYAAYTRPLSDKWDMTAQLGFKGLQNSFFSYQESWQPFSNFGYVYEDTFLLRMNAMTIETDFKKFRYGQHGNGLYLFCGAGATFVRTNVNASLTVHETENENTLNPYTVSTRENLPTWKQTAVFGTVQAGIGGNIRLSKLLYLDLGLKLKYQIGPGRNAFGEVDYSADPNTTDKSGFSYSEEFAPVVQQLTRINALRSYYLELYVKIGLSL